MRAGEELDENDPSMTATIKKWWNRILTDERMKPKPFYDLRALGGLTTPEDRLRLKSIYAVLVVDILWRLRTPGTRTPSIPEVMVILQINHYL
jgi:hypothetical protein